MPFFVRSSALVILGLFLAACSGNPADQSVNLPSPDPDRGNSREYGESTQSTLTGLLLNQPDPSVNIRVNRYLWRASLDTLAFLPLEDADPFSGVIVTGWGRVSGASGQYRATVYIQDAALDARSLRVSVFRRSGNSGVPVSNEVTRRVEDAILTRARQLKVARASR